MKSAIGILLAISVSPFAAQAQIDPSWLSGMTARSIGPAGMSGRVAAVDVVADDPDIIYVGAATGGVWQSVDGGLRWKPVFDDQPVSSIGAIGIFQPNPDVVWIGTGEGNPRNSAGVGTGVYRSVDGGRTWTHVGLERSERIHRLLTHPTDPAVAYVAALGPTWSDGEERGVFKTTDGGHTWERMLYVDARTGAADLVMDPSNPDKLFAAMWEHRRWPWFFASGGVGSGLYVTHDGGATWRRITSDDGLPPGDLGRIGIAIARSNPDVVYALVEATESALLRSDDGGVSWHTISDEPGIAPRPFYYADIRVDPENENRLYSLHGRITVSEDQGRSFRTVVPSAKIHGDVQELWIHPRDGRFLIVGNDGGIGISYDRGASWRFVPNLPVGQFYHLSVDMERPFNVYGGLQDNGSWFGPSAVWQEGGIRNYHWMRVGGGDGFATFADFADPRYGYTMSQQAFIRRFDKLTGERKDIRPVHPDGIPLRFNWNAALNIDPFDSTVLYLGSQFVHRSRDHGVTWEIISPDLTTNDPEKQRSFESGGLTRDASGAENHTTIITIAPSPVERGVIWVGTDDGNLQLTRDGGDSWTNVVDRVPGVPAHTWVPHIEPSKFDGGTAFVVFDDHRRGNWETYVFTTTDYGRNWRSLATEALRGFAHVIEQDPLEPNLLFLGTEFAVYVSLNAGRAWLPLTHGLPTVPYRALVVHPRDHDLAIGTHGRGVYILDDVRPLRGLAREPTLVDKPLHLFTAPAAQQYRVAEAVGYRSTGDAMFFGENRPYGATLSYWVSPSTAGGQVEIEIRDADAEAVRTMTGPATAGVNRVTWNLRRDSVTTPSPDGEASSRDGPEVLPGSYAVELRHGDASVTGTVEVVSDPRVSIPLAERREKFAAVMRVAQRLELAAEAVRRVGATAEAIQTITQALRKRDPSSALAADGDNVRLRLQRTVDEIAYRPAGQGLFNTGDLVGGRLMSLYGSLQTSWDAPTESQQLAFNQADAALRAVVDELNRLFADEVAAFGRRVEAAGLSLIPDWQAMVVRE